MAGCDRDTNHMNEDGFITGKNFETMFTAVCKPTLCDKKGYNLPSVLVVSGRAGTGKTVTCDRLWERYLIAEKIEDHEELLFDSSTTDEICKSFQDINENHSLDLNAYIMARCRKTEYLSDCLEKVYVALRGKYANKHILLRFKNVDRPTRVLKWVDESICKIVTREESREQQEFRKVKVFIESRDGRTKNWRQDCGRLSVSPEEKIFFKVEPFNLTQTKRYLKEVQELDDNDKKAVHELVGGLPSALYVAKQKLMDNQTSTHKEYIALHKHQLESLNPHSQLLPTEHGILELLQNLSRPHEAKKLIDMLGIFHEKNLPNIFMLDLARMALDELDNPSFAKMRRYPPINVNDFLNEIVSTMEGKQVMHFASGGDQQIRFFHLPKLVKQQIRTASDHNGDESPQVRRDLVLMCLIALTRTLMYHDYVDAYPEICEPMFKHGESLATHVRRLMTEDVVNKAESPLILLLFATLLSCLAYLKMKQRKIERARSLHTESVEILVELLGNCKVVELSLQYDGPRPDANLEEKLAYTLHKLCNSAEYLKGDVQYRFCANLARFTKLSLRQFNMMTLTMSHPNSCDYHVSNQLTAECILELERTHKTVPEVHQIQLFLHELTINVFATGMKLSRFYMPSERSTHFDQNECSQQEVVESSYSSGIIAKYLCSYADDFIKDTIPDLSPARLTAGIAVEIELQSLRLKLRNTDHNNPEGSLQLFNETNQSLMLLKRQKALGLQFGIPTTEFESAREFSVINDLNRATYHSELYNMVNHDERLQRLNEGIVIVCGCKEEIAQHSQSFSHLTQSETHRVHAALLAKKTDFGGAIKEIIDGMICLEKFVEQRNGTPLSILPSCGTFRGMLFHLKSYYHKWNPDDNNHLNDDLFNVHGQDQNEEKRIEFLQSFLEINPDALDQSADQELWVLTRLSRKRGNVHPE